SVRRTAGRIPTMPEKPLVARSFRVTAMVLRYLWDDYTVRIWLGGLPPSPDERDVLLDGAVGALTHGANKVDGNVRDRHPNLRVVSNYAVGYDDIHVLAATAGGSAVCSTPDG